MESKEFVSKIKDSFLAMNSEARELFEQLERDLEALNILKPRISLKDSTLKNAYFVVGENGLPELQQDLKDVDVAFVEASGFVFKNSAEYKLLKE